MSRFDLAYLAGAISYDALIASFLFRDDLPGNARFPYPTLNEASAHVKTIQSLCKTDIMVLKDRIKSHCRASQHYRHFG